MRTGCCASSTVLKLVTATAMETDTIACRMDGSRPPPPSPPVPPPSPCPSELLVVDPDLSKANRLKEDGNHAFAAGRLSDAVYSWTQAFNEVKHACRTLGCTSGSSASARALQAVLQANLAQGYLKVTVDQWTDGDLPDTVESRFHLALNAAEVAIGFDDKSAKAHVRRARALVALELPGAARSVAKVAIDGTQQPGLFDFTSSSPSQRRPLVTWRRLKQVGAQPGGRWHHTLTALGNEVMLLGGSTFLPPQPVNWIQGRTCVDLFACAVNEDGLATWRRVHWRAAGGRCTSEAAMTEPPPGLTLHTAVSTGGTLLVFGGESIPSLPCPQLAGMPHLQQVSRHSRGLDGLYEWTPSGARGSWRRIGGNIQPVASSWPPARYAHVAISTRAAMWVFGGIGPDGHARNDTWRFVYATQAWEEVRIKQKYRPPERAFAASAFDATSNRWYILSGCSHNVLEGGKEALPIEAWFADVWFLDTNDSKPKWSLLIAPGETPNEGNLGGRSQSTAFIASQGDKSSLYLFGGFRRDFSIRYFSTLHELSVGAHNNAVWQLTDCSDESAPPPIGRCGAVACTLPDGTFLITHGCTEGGMLDEVFLARATQKASPKLSKEPTSVPNCTNALTADKQFLVAEIDDAMRVYDEMTNLMNRAMFDGGHGGARMLPQMRCAIAAMQCVGFQYAVFLDLYLARQPGRTKAIPGTYLSHMIHAYSSTALILKWLGRFAEAEAYYWKGLDMALSVPTVVRSSVLQQVMKQVAKNVLVCYRPAWLTSEQEATLVPRGERILNNTRVAAAMRIAVPEDIRASDTDEALCAMHFNERWLSVHGKGQSPEALRQMAEQGIGFWRDDTLHWVPARCHCGLEERQPHQFNKCARCKRVAYCSSGCQATAWQGGHKRECKRWAAEGPLEAPATVEHLDSERSVTPLAKLLSDLCSGAEDDAIAAVSKVLPAQLRETCFPVNERTRFSPLDVAHQLGHKRALRVMASHAFVQLGPEWFE